MELVNIFAHNMEVSIINKTIVTLPRLTCLLLDFPENGEDCSLNDEGTCLQCSAVGQFISGESVGDNGPSQIFCILIWILTTVIGSISTLANCVIIVVLLQKRRTAFDSFLITLAVFDLLSSVLSVVSVTSAIIYFRECIIILILRF